MKKIAALLLALMLTGLCACGGSSFDQEDLSLTVGGVTVTAETPVEDILAGLGDAYTYSEAISCVYEGMDKTYDYEDLSLYTYPDETGDCLMELYCVAGDVKTAGGISLGASKADVEACYGGDYEAAGSTMIYELPVSQEENLPASLYFVLDNDVVTAIALTTEHRAE